MSSPSTDSAETRLSGRWLVLARAIWLAIVVFTFALFVIGLPAHYTRLQQPCVGAVACQLNGALTAASMRTLQAAGFSVSSYAAYTIALNIVFALLWAAVGLVIFWRRSDDWMALLAALTLVLYNAGQQNGPLTALALAHPAWSSPVGVATFLSEVPIVLFLLLFPSGRFAPRWTRWAVPIALIQAICLIFPPADSPLNGNNWPLALNGLLFISLLLVVVFSQIYRYRRVSNVVQRQQIKWAVFGLIVYVVLLIGLSVFASIGPLDQAGSLFEPVINTLYPLAALPLPVSIGIAIVRYRLYDIDVIIRRTLVYGSLTAILVGIYLVGVVGVQALLGRVAGQVVRQEPILIVATTLLIAALFQPLRRHLQRLIDQRFYRSKYDTARTLATFGRALRSEVELAQLRDHLLATVEETMRPEHVSLWLRQPPLTRESERKDRP